jgi:hypothetical protein
MDQGLGRFFDRRLEKGGPFFWRGFSRLANRGCGFDRLAAIAPGRSGSDGSCVILV